LTRVEELTAAWLDGTASQAEREELETLVAGDAEARRLHLSLMDVEVALRGARPAGLADAVMREIEGQRTERAVRGVMRQVSSMTPVARGPRPRPHPRLPRWLPVLAVAMTVAVLAGLLWRSQPAPVAIRPPPARRPEPAFGIATQGKPLEPSLSKPLAASTLLRFDFEDGALPPLFLDGALATQGCARGSLHCAQGTISAYDRRRQTITVERPNPPLLRFAPNQVLSFDYRAGLDGPPLRVQVWVPARHRNFAASLPAMERDRWGHLELRLGDLVGHRAGRRLAAGDEISNIMISAGRAGGTPFLVDNLRVTAYPDDESLPETSALHALSP
jgi:hypothetical protein